MRKSLYIQAIIKYILGVLFVGIFLFLPAGSFHYENGWLLMAILFIPMGIVGIVLMKVNPSLLAKRLKMKESEKIQKKVIGASALMFISAFVLAGFSYRYEFLLLPKSWSLCFSIVFLFGYALFGLVLKENVYLSRSIEVQKNQVVVDTGLYGIVRHPMYLATLILFLSMGFILGSIVSVGILCFYIPIISKRIENEEQVLEKQLAGYKAYQHKVKYKMIPKIW